MTLAAKAMAILLSLSPLDQGRETLPGWEETRNQRAARYLSIATDVETVILSSCKDNERCIAWALPALLGVAWHESGFAPDTDLGPCYRGKDGASKRCDSGRAKSMWQIQAAGEKGDLIQSDRKFAIKTALRKLLRSMGACKAYSEELRLSAYAGGRCDNYTAQKRSRELWEAISRARLVK